MTALVEVQIACNDPRDGNPMGRAVAVNIAGVEFEALNLPEPKFVETEGAFRLSGKRWRFRKSTSWVGNWCWDAFWMPRDDAADFLLWLRRRGLFFASSGPVTLMDWFQSGADIDRAALLAMIDGAAE